MEPFILVLIVLIVVLAGFVQGLVGFGSGLVMVPILVAVIEPRLLIPVVLLQGLIMNWSLTLGTRKHIEIKRVMPILAGGMLGIPIGSAMLLFMPQSYLKIMIGIVVALFGGALLIGASLKIKREGPLSFPLGIASGVLNGSISLSGPPIILFFSNQKVAKENFRANLVFYFFALNVVTTLVFLFTGLITWDVLYLFFILLPAALIGTFIGTKISKRVDQKLFRRIALLLVIGAGVLSLISGLSEF